jgi:hypothetical protein
MTPLPVLTVSTDSEPSSVGQWTRTADIKDRTAMHILPKYGYRWAELHETQSVYFVNTFPTDVFPNRPNISKILTTFLSRTQVQFCPQCARMPPNETARGWKCCSAVLRHNKWRNVIHICRKSRKFLCKSWLTLSRLATNWRFLGNFLGVPSVQNVINIRWYQVSGKQTDGLNCDHLRPIRTR